MTNTDDKSLHYSTDPKLFPLAWVAELDRDRWELQLRVGNSVEVGKDFAVEGVWDGPFADGDFDRTDVVFGTGVRRRPGQVAFVPSCTTMEHVYFSDSVDTSMLCVSNSLPALLAHLGVRLRPDFLDYDGINDSLQEGINGYERSIPTTGRPVQRAMFHNVVVSRSGLVLEEKPFPPEFSDYREYEGYLDSRYASLEKNARSVARRKPMSILSTQSRGYDTTAVNAIAAQYDVDLALTITKAKTSGRYTTFSSGNGESDDGTEICDRLGIPVAHLSRRAFLDAGPVELLFHAGSHSCQDGNMLGVREHVSGPTILLTGTWGEIWYSERCYDLHLPEKTNSDMRRPGGDLGGYGLAEVRLAWEVVPVHLPFMGGRNMADIRRITDSEELAPWRLDNDYDRPIARRLGEERGGVPGHLFGQAKLASVVELPEPYFPVSKGLDRDFCAWLAEHDLVPGYLLPFRGLIRKYNATVYFKPAVVYYTERVLSMIVRRRFEFSRFWMHLRGSLYCYAVNRVADDVAGSGK